MRACAARACWGRRACDCPLLTVSMRIDPPPAWGHRGDPSLLQGLQLVVEVEEFCAMWNGKAASADTAARQLFQQWRSRFPALSDPVRSANQARSMSARAPSSQGSPCAGDGCLGAAVLGLPAASGPWDDVVTNRAVMHERWTERQRRDDERLDRMAVDHRGGSAASVLRLDDAAEIMLASVRSVPRGRRSDQKASKFFSGRARAWLTGSLLACALVDAIQTRPETRSRRSCARHCTNETGLSQTASSTPTCLLTSVVNFRVPAPHRSSGAASEPSVDPRGNRCGRSGAVPERPRP